jgi:hypothetical protein
MLLIQEGKLEMKLEHLIKAYIHNGVEAELNRNGSERAGTIKYADGINSAYMVDEDDTVIAMKLYINCLARAMNVRAQKEHTIKAIKVIQQSIMLIGNITLHECNMILKSLGIFDGTFQKRKTNKAPGQRI